MTGISKLKLIEIANRIPLFKALSGHEKEQVVSIPKIVKAIKAGDRFIKYGERTDSFYIILSGKASVYQKNTKLAEIEGGQFVGEVGFICDEPRTANVIADTDLITFMVDKTRFNQFPILLRDKIKDKLITGLITRIEKMNGNIVDLKAEITALQPLVVEEDSSNDEQVVVAEPKKSGVKAAVPILENREKESDININVESVSFDNDEEIEEEDAKTKQVKESEDKTGSPWCSS